MKKEIFLTTSLILETLFIFAIPGLTLFYYYYQNINYAHLNREVKALIQKKESLIRKNDELKIGIASITSSERIESIYKRTYNYIPVAAHQNKIITLTLPPENPTNGQKVDTKK